MKRLTLLLILAAMMVGCEKSPYESRIMRIDECKQGQQQYHYRVGIDFETFYAPCNAYQIGQSILTDSLTTHKP